jgi:hypothetical protein
VAHSIEVVALLADGIAEALGLGCIVGLERGVFPIPGKLGGAAAEQVGKLAGGAFDGPFETAGHGGVGEICGTDVGGGEPGLAVEEVSFGVQAGGVGVVVDADLGIGQRGEFFDDGGIGIPHVTGGDEP